LHQGTRLADGPKGLQKRGRWNCSADLDKRKAHANRRERKKKGKKEKRWNGSNERQEKQCSESSSSILHIGIRSEWRMGNSILKRSKVGYAGREA
jgi:hypothetical protein